MMRNDQGGTYPRGKGECYQVAVLIELRNDLFKNFIWKAKERRHSCTLLQQKMGHLSKEKRKGQGKRRKKNWRF
jgi:hypothetical protein